MDLFSGKIAFISRNNITCKIWVFFSRTGKRAKLKFYKDKLYNDPDKRRVKEIIL